VRIEGWRDGEGRQATGASVEGTTGAARCKSRRWGSVKQSPYAAQRAGELIPPLSALGAVAVVPAFSSRRLLALTRLLSLPLSLSHSLSSSPCRSYVPATTLCHYLLPSFSPPSHGALRDILLVSPIDFSRTTSRTISVLDISPLSLSFWALSGVAAC